MDKLTQEIMNFIQGLEAKPAYEAQIANAVEEEDYERAERIKKNMDAECK